MRVKEILQQKGITQKELAEILGMTPTGLNLAISEDGNPPLKRLRQIADALGVSLGELFMDAPSSKEIVAFFYHKGRTHTPTTINEVMDILMDWNKSEFHKVCQSRFFNHLDEEHWQNADIMKLRNELCTLLNLDCDTDTKHN